MRQHGLCYHQLAGQCHGFLRSGVFVQAGEFGQGRGVAGGGDLPVEASRAVRVPVQFPDPSHLGQCGVVAGIDGRSCEYACWVGLLSARPCQFGQGGGVACLGDLPVEGVRTLRVAALLTQSGELGHDSAVRGDSGALNECFGALQVTVLFPQPC